MASTLPGLVLQHGPAGPPGVLAAWLADRGLPHEVHAAWRDPLPGDPSAYGWIASLGSQHSAIATEPAWVAREVALLRGAAAAGVPVLGLCFGGQALAVALGGDVELAAAPEVGWLAVQTHAPDVVPPGPWLQFHWEVFRPPPGARELARSPAGPAAFVHGPHLAVQFHPEATPEICVDWAEHERERLAPLGLTPEGLREQASRDGAEAARQAHRLFDAWLERSGAWNGR